MHSYPSWLLWIALPLAAWTSTGCGGGPRTVNVSGTVTLEGRPVEGAAVMLEPEAGGPPTSAVTDASGSFRIETTVIGPHKVAISKTETTFKGGREVDEGGFEDVDQQYHTPMHYASTLTSGLTVDVQPRMEPLTFDLQP